jgi:hypothetical protein
MNRVLRWFFAAVLVCAWAGCATTEKHHGDKGGCGKCPAGATCPHKEKKEGDKGDAKGCSMKEKGDDSGCPMKQKADEKK